MNRLALKDMFRVPAWQRDNDSTDVECFVDLSENQALCSGDSCGLNWKPTIPKNDRAEDTES